MPEENKEENLKMQIAPNTNGNDNDKNTVYEFKKIQPKETKKSDDHYHNPSKI